MKQTIYVDVLLAVNLMVDFFLLCCAAHLAGRRLSRTRLCLAAAVGAAGSLTILLPAMHGAVSLMISSLLAALMTLVGFGFGGVRTYLRTAGSLLAVTLCYGGLMTALWVIAAPRGLAVRNGAVYIDIPPLLLVASTAVCYGVISLGSRLIRRRNLSRSSCTVTVTRGGISRTTAAIIDTGNLLTEPFSGLPVIIAEADAMSEVMPDGMFEMLSRTDGQTGAEGVRVVPYRGFGGDGVMLAFLPDRLTVEIAGRTSEAKAYVGITGGHVGREYHAVINPDAIL